MILINFNELFFFKQNSNGECDFYNLDPRNNNKTICDKLTNNLCTWFTNTSTNTWDELSLWDEFYAELVNNPRTGIYLILINKRFAYANVGARRDSAHLHTVSYRRAADG